MIEFFKNQSGMTISVDDLATLIEYDMVGVVSEIIIALDKGEPSIEETSFENIIRILNNGPKQED